MNEAELLAATGNAWKVKDATDPSRAVYVRAATACLAAMIGAKKLRRRNLVVTAWDPRTERWGGGIELREATDDEP